MDKSKTRVNKMYMVEVFNKFPVLQHFWCGEVLYPWKDHQGNDLPVNEKRKRS